MHFKRGKAPRWKEIVYRIVRKEACVIKERLVQNIKNFEETHFEKISSCIDSQRLLFFTHTEPKLDSEKMTIEFSNT